MNERNAMVSPLPSSVLDALQRARKLIAKPESWTQRSHARDANGDAVPAASPGAVCWCAVGALFNVIPPHAVQNSKFHHKMLSGALALVAEGAECSGSIYRFNDEAEHKHVLRAYDVAILLAGGAPRW